MDAAVIKKRLEYEKVKARIKELEALKNCGICGADKAKACQGCGTTAYCSTACQRIDWRDRGHRKACKKIQAERAAEAARAEAARAEAARAEAALATPTPPPAPPPEVFYGPAPRSHADEVRARAAEHEAARARREANPAPKPLSARFGSRCPICFEDWDHDLGKAKHWLARAAAKGDEVAIRLLENIDDQEQFDEREQAAERAAAELLRELDGA
ncbi:hypothetical protein JL721_10419 [Aureococcus anophagefferens]|nr:hypothetical protein JL721_10419 [Aureococcus anophagefferens]